MVIVVFYPSYAGRLVFRVLQSSFSYDLPSRVPRAPPVNLVPPIEPLNSPPHQSEMRCAAIILRRFISYKDDIDVPPPSDVLRAYRVAIVSGQAPAVIASKRVPSTFFPKLVCVRDEVLSLEPKEAVQLAKRWKAYRYALKMRRKHLAREKLRARKIKIGERRKGGGKRWERSGKGRNAKTAEKEAKRAGKGAKRAVDKAKKAARRAIRKAKNEEKRLTNAAKKGDKKSVKRAEQKQNRAENADVRAKRLAKKANEKTRKAKKEEKKSKNANKKTKKKRSKKQERQDKKLKLAEKKKQLDVGGFVEMEGAASDVATPAAALRAKLEKLQHQRIAQEKRVAMLTSSFHPKVPVAKGVAAPVPKNIGQNDAHIAGPNMEEEARELLGMGIQKLTPHSVVAGGVTSYAASTDAAKSSFLDSSTRALPPHPQWQASTTVKGGKPKVGDPVKVVDTGDGRQKVVVDAGGRPHQNHTHHAVAITSTNGLLGRNKRSWLIGNGGRCISDSRFQVTVFVGGTHVTVFQFII